MELNKYNVKDFSETIGADNNEVQKLMYNSKSISYTTKPLENLIKMVEKSNIENSKKQIVVEYLYYNLYNRELDRYNTKKYFNIEF